jgi:hypothetical protein
LWFAPPAPPPPSKQEIAAAKKAERAAQKKVKCKNDPKLVELARELSAKYLEQVNTGLLLPPGANGKYDVSRQLEAAPSPIRGRGAMKVEQIQPVDLLEAA